MYNAERYPFLSGDPALGEASFHPYLPLTLGYQEKTVATTGLLDTGASVNVLPYALGIELGYEWESQTTTLRLTGNLAQHEARVVLAQAVVGQLEPVQLVFAWTQATNVPHNQSTTFPIPTAFTDTEQPARSRTWQIGR